MIVIKLDLVAAFSFMEFLFFLSQFCLFCERIEGLVFLCMFGCQGKVAVLVKVGTNQSNELMSCSNKTSLKCSIY